MSGWQAFGTWLARASLVLDPYERQARLSPALLCILPLAVMCAALYPEQVFSLRGLLGLASGVGLMYLLADHARRLGRKREPQLYQNWGGTPSVQVLRHRDPTIDAVSKAKYHEILSNRLRSNLPTASEEATDPDAADAFYAAACNWLRENTRDKKKFNLLFRDNVAYGYQRNGYGIRPLGIIICLAVLSWLALRGGTMYWHSQLAAAATPEDLLGAGEVVSAGVALFMLYTWLFNFSAEGVRDAAFTYARRLVLSCESLPARKPRGTKAIEQAVATH